MTKSAEEQPAAVSAKTIRAREILRLIVQVEPKVWTERMLTALVQGVKGGKWFSLIDKVHPERTLQAAFSQVAANQGAAGVDHVTISMFETRLDEELRRLSEHLRNGTYRPQAIRRHYIPKPGTQEKRPLGIPICRSYCTSLQRGWGLSGGGLGPSVGFVSVMRPIAATRSDGWACASRAMISGVNWIHQGPWGADWIPSRMPDWHQSAIVDTFTLSNSAATLRGAAPIRPIAIGARRRAVGTATRN